MRIAVMGSGGVGAYYGASLARAGYEVIFIARGAHLAALQTSGLRVTGLEEFHLPTVQATDRADGIGPVDVVLFTVKAYDTADSARLILPLVGPQTMVLPLQNGIDSVEQIGAVLGRDRVVGGLCRISAELAGPGVVQLNSSFKDILFGEPDGSSSARTADFSAALTKASIPHRVSKNVQVDLWEKYVFITAFSAITGAAHAPVGPIRECPESLELFRQVVREAVAVARAQGILLDESLPDQYVARAHSYPPGMKASLLVDLERGRRTEVETLQGTLVRLGNQLGVPTPVTAVLYALIKLHLPH